MAVAACGPSAGPGGRLGKASPPPGAAPPNGAPGSAPQPGGAGGQEAPSTPGGFQPCASELAHFDEVVWRETLSTECAGCHSPGAPAAATRFVLPADGGARERYDAFAAIARVELSGTSIVLLKPTGLHPGGHVGGTRVPPFSEGYEALSAFVRYSATDACDAPDVALVCDGTETGPRVLRRLTGGELDRTLAAALGVDSDWGARFPADPVVHGFEGHAPSLFVTPVLAGHIAAAAADLAGRVDLQALAGCDPAASGCRDQLIERVGTRLYRRPLDPEERARLLALADRAPGEPGLRLVVEAMIQSPHFLYRSELGRSTEVPGRFALTAFEVATQLAFFLTGTGPDDALLEAARRGDLDSVAGIEVEARRLARSPAGRAQQARFFERWLDFGQIGTVPKDTEVYPELDAATRDALRRETERFVARALESGATLAELLTLPYTEVEPRLSTFYGEAGTPVGDGWVRLDTPGRHFGLLTQGSVLAAHARPNDSSPVHRGRLIRERLFCQDLPPPPPGVATDPPPPVPGQTARERYLAHSEDPACRGCHRLIDPIGFGFEAFDGIGRYRPREGGEPVDASGEIVETPQSNGTFQDLGALAALLGASPDVRACFVRQWLRFSTGLDDDPALACLREELTTGLGAEATIDDLLVAIATSIHITERTGGAEAPPEPEPEPSPEPEPPPPTSPGLEVTETVDSEWPTGRCVHVTVENRGLEPVTWVIELDVGGTLTTHWNAERTGDAGVVRFRGVHWNAEIPPEESAAFGFCVTF